jgi:hypothetical protein
MRSKQNTWPLLHAQVQAKRAERRAKEGKTCPICGFKYLWPGPTCSTTCTNEWVVRQQKATVVPSVPPS